MESIKHFLYVSGITVLYNIFFTKTANMMYKDMFYTERKEKTAVFLIFIALMSIIISCYGIKGYPTIKRGIKWGGILLLIFTFFDNWSVINDTIKLTLIGLFLILMLICA